MISKMNDGESQLVGGLFNVARKICAEKSVSDYRLVVNNGALAGQTVFHIHLHILAGRAMNWPPG
jgi:histidine triad (HIT) family protein